MVIFSWCHNEADALFIFITDIHAHVVLKVDLNTNNPNLKLINQLY